MTGIEPSRARRALILVVASLAILLVPIGAASSDEWGQITGSVFGPTGTPAVGACVTRGESVVVVDGDGEFEFEAVADRSYLLRFFNCSVPDDVYPYETQYWENATEQEDATLVTVGPGETATVRMVLPLKQGGPPELGAVSGDLLSDGADVVGWRKVSLIDASGLKYWAYTNGSSYTAAAPPGSYKLFTSIDGTDENHLPVFYGHHARGFAASWDEAETVTIAASGDIRHGMDVVVPAGQSYLDDGATAGTRLVAGGTITNTPVRVDMFVSDDAPYGRVGVRLVGESPHTLDQAEAWAFPRLDGSESDPVTIRLYESLVAGVDIDTLPVWSGFNLVPDCVPGTTDVCVETRVAEDFLGDDVVKVVIQNNRGAIFKFGDRPQFYDSADSVFASAILWLADEGITKGCNPPVNDRFCPDDAVTRGQMAAFLVRALGLVDRGDVGFVDDDGSVFEAHIERLATAGITKGCNPPVNDEFCPDSPVTRGQMAAFLSRAVAIP